MSLKIIYIDDEPALCQIFVDNFASPDVCISTYVEPEQGMAAIAQDPPDLVLLDYRLPNTTGDQLAKRIDSRVPKVLITGDLNVHPSAGFLRVFSKPFDFDEMAAIIEGLRKQKAAS